MGWGRKSPNTLGAVKRELIGDSIERKKLVEKLVHLVREDERERVLAVTDKARARAAERKEG